MIKIKTIFTHQEASVEMLRQKNVIIIDVLRATSVMATALQNGVQEIQTVAEIASAFQKKNENKDLLLAGERNAQKIEGFDLGNSPLEMTKEKLKGKSLIMSTSNGTQAVKIAREAKSLRAAAFINMASVVKDLLLLKEDFTLLCSGTNARFSLDDALAAGILINRIKANTKVHLCDNSLMCSLSISRENKLKESLKDSYHLQLLQQRGFQKDVDYCLSLDIVDIVPVLEQGRFVAKQ
ncbi:MAG: 2-phosphosulfolactate phosphatase [Bacteroidetes bacterium 4572_77]|nr:MAG: 2-phosphosulfolactate phosphatase [Bacteroidetes bacterium 4572_77]